MDESVILRRSPVWRYLLLIFTEICIIQTGRLSLRHRVPHPSWGLGQVS